MGSFHKSRPASGTERLAPLLLSLSAAAVVLVMSATHAVPAYYHDLAANRQPCSDCHTLHYSEAGQRPTTTPPGGVWPITVEAGGPFPQLLVRKTSIGLCLFCHDGSDPKAPDVLSDAMYTVPPSGDEHSGAGFFENSGGTSDKGHDLGVNFSNPDGSRSFTTLNNITLSCASCHDPHGTLNYRNVLTSPAGGIGVTVEPGKDVIRNVPPGDPPSASATIAAYKKSNEGYVANTSKWCTECHDKLKDHVGGSTPVQRSHHRGDVAINDPAFSLVVNATDWANGAGEGFGTTTEVTETGTPGVPRLRFQVPNATSFAEAQIPAANNQVMCGTCHLAHGGRYISGLVWPRFEGPPSPIDVDAGCLQCHNM